VINVALFTFLCNVEEKISLDLQLQFLHCFHFPLGLLLQNFTDDLDLVGFFVKGSSPRLVFK